METGKLIRGNTQTLCCLVFLTPPATLQITEVLKATDSHIILLFLVFCNGISIKSFRTKKAKPNQTNPQKQTNKPTPNNLEKPGKGAGRGCDAKWNSSVLPSLKEKSSEC